VRVLITGVAGFAGRHLLRHLVERGDREIHGADHVPLDRLADPEPLRSALASYRALEVTDSEAVESWIRERRPEQLVHLAAQASGMDSMERPAETYRVNALGALNVMEALRVSGSRARLLLVGSADIYGSGPAGGTIREDAPIRPQNPYSVSKAAQDQLGELYALTFGLGVIRTRTFTHTGPGQRPRFALAGFAEQLARIDAGLAPPEIRVGNLDVVREYGDVRDVVRAYDLLLERGVPGEAYNIATGLGHRLRDLLDRLIAVSGVRATVATDPSRVRARDTDHLVGDPSKLHGATGWTPELPIERTLADLYASARDRVQAETRLT
jgi:GDP-4-dehydro-6-deoxy-D-mannose reductase